MNDGKPLKRRNDKSSSIILCDDGVIEPYRYRCEGNKGLCCGRGKCMSCDRIVDDNPGYQAAKSYLEQKEDHNHDKTGFYLYSFTENSNWKMYAIGTLLIFFIMIIFNLAWCYYWCFVPEVDLNVYKNETYLESSDEEEEEEEEEEEQYNLDL